jgi:hypothetical protein
MGPRHAIAPPCRAGRQRYILEAEGQDIICRKVTVKIDLDIRHLVELKSAVVAHAPPGRKAGQPAFFCDAPAKLRPGLGQGNLVAAQAQSARCFKPGRSRAHDQDALRRALGLHPFRMPTLAPFLHEGRILRAARNRHGHVARYADVAADAFANVLDPPLFHLPGQEGIGNRGSGATDEIERA